MKRLPDKDDCDRYGELLGEAAAIGFRLIDDPDFHRTGSYFEAMRSAVSNDPTVLWTSRDARVAEELVRAFIGIAARHLRGKAALLSAGPVVHLHPLSALIRSIGESCGSLFWHTEPWIDRSGDLTFEQRCEQVFARSMLLEATELFHRRRRIGAMDRERTPAWDAADSELTNKKSEILHLFPATVTRRSRPSMHRTLAAKRCSAARLSSKD